MITSGYKGFGRSGIVFPSILPRVSALKKMAVCRKFELDLGDKGLIYHVFVQPSVFFSASLKNRRSLGLYFSHGELNLKFGSLWLSL
jgi:hypothetical protein